MSLEPTSVERQRLAFGYLREQAAHANIAGDGLLANLLCHVGLDRAARLADSKLLLLPLTELCWMPIFALYWLVSPHERHVVEEAMKKLPRMGDADAAIAEWLTHHAFLIQQPLVGGVEVIEKLLVLPWPAFFATPSPEAETLLTHLIELIWFRSPAEGEWEKVAQTWEKSGPTWAKDNIRALRERLVAQTRLTSPSKKYSPFPESTAVDLRRQSAFAELWLLHLHGRKKEVCSAVERLTPGISGDTHQWRILGDFAYIDAFLGKSEESAGVHLARRRRLSADTPLLIFHDKREQQIEDTLGELFRARREGMASRRWEVFTLAMLHELSALRLWDYGMWLEAIRSQAEVLLESMQWTGEHPSFSAHGLVLAVTGLAIQDPDKDPTLRKAIDRLEFASTEILTALANGILMTYPLQKHHAVELLKDVTDLLPASRWPELARWTIGYATESAEGRSGGQRLAPAVHWVWALPIVPADSDVGTRFSRLHSQWLALVIVGAVERHEPLFDAGFCARRFHLPVKWRKQCSLSPSRTLSSV